MKAMMHNRCFVISLYSFKAAGRLYIGLQMLPLRIVTEHELVCGWQPVGCRHLGNHESLKVARASGGHGWQLMALR